MGYDMSEDDERFERQRRDAEAPIRAMIREYERVRLAEGPGREIARALLRDALKRHWCPVREGEVQYRYERGSNDIVRSELRARVWKSCGPVPAHRLRAEALAHRTDEHESAGLVEID